MNRVAAFILARGGSKGLPGKNTMDFAGKPLLSWSVDVAKEVSQVDRVFVSSDCSQIGEVAENAGAEFLVRPESLASDTALPKDAIRYHVEQLVKEGWIPDIIVLLQPTSPLRSSEDIEACLDAVISGADSAVTFMKAPSNPHRSWRVENSVPIPFIEGVDPWLPRQALPEAFAINGAVYASNAEKLLSDQSPSFIVGKSTAVVMPPERSVDIDTLLDFKIAEVVKKFLDEQN